MPDHAAEEAGCWIEPPVSGAQGCHASPAPPPRTARLNAAWHPLGVPGIAAGGPKAEVSVELPMANSSRFGFTPTAPRRLAERFGDGLDS